MDFAEWMQVKTQHFESCLQAYFKDTSYPSPHLQEAMRYSVFTPGKRIRPLLVYAVGDIFGAPLENLDAAALSVELIHSYSLIHDDLPAMDNAETRRGQPSCFKAFGEDVAILAGDALQTLAFEILAKHPAPLSAEQRIAMVSVLARASGAAGMAGGQALDIQNNTTSSEAELLKLYQLKTGALLEASAKLGLIASTASLNDSLLIEKYAKNISLAFQIQDDILDIEGEKAHVGKPVGQDAELNKKTYPKLVGLAAAKEKVRQLFDEAFEALINFHTSAEALRALTHAVGNRDK